MKAKGIWIDGNFPSFKNSKRMIIREEQRPLLIHSKTVMKYKKVSKLDWLENRDAFHHLIKDMKKPLVIGVHFVRNSKRIYDWINMVQGVQDLMVDYEYIKDDNILEMVPIPFKMKGSYSSYNKEKPGVWLAPISPEVLKQLKGNINN